MAEAIKSEETCQNCGTELTGLYCSTCGQKSSEVNVSFRSYVTTSLGEFFSLDARIFNTLWFLLRQPGFLTLAYFAGRRVRYVPPLKLYLSTSFVLFFTLAMIASDITRFSTKTSSSSGTPSGEEPSSPAIVDTTSALLDSSGVFRTPSDTLLFRSAPDDIGTTEDNVVESGIGNENNGDSLNTSSLFRQRLNAGLQRARDPDSGFKSDLRDRLPAMMFFLLPVFALLLKLLYARRKRLYIQHFIFSLHLHAFAYLIIFSAVLINTLSENDSRTRSIFLPNSDYSPTFSLPCDTCTPSRE